MFSASGPYRFVPGERIVGARVVYARNADYAPREDGTTSFTAGPKRANFDRVEWQVISDQGTAAAALQNGEVDWWETPTADLWPLLCPPDLATALGVASRILNGDSVF